MASINNFNPNNSSGGPGSPPPGGSGHPGNPGNPNGPGGFGPYASYGDDVFDPSDYLINYNDKFANSLPVMFRDLVTQQTLSCLISKFKPNALLVGAAGVGKTKIVEDIARRIATNDVLIPDQIKSYTVWELPLSNIVSGSNYVGDVEKKAKAIIAFATNPANKVILFIDEIHLLFGRDKTYDKIAQMLKPAMARGDIRVIGATTLQESQSLLSDPAFGRRFSRIIVDELSQSQTKEILSQLSVSMFEHYGKKITINDKVIEEVILVADEYRTAGSHRPDNAITLLDRSMADAYIQRKTLENAAQSDPALQAVLKNTPVVALSKSQMRKTAHKLATGNNEKTDINYADLRDKLSVIKGQDDILDFITDCLERDSLNLCPRSKPLTLLFAGNSGVGKSEIAKIIAKEITGMKPIILNMTEYHSSASINRIIGSPAGYIGSDSRAELPFDMLESNPYQVILLDEFEKADKAVKRLFMSAFDEGYIKTARGVMIDFSKAIIIATTNAGHTNKSDSIGLTTTSENNTATVSDLSAFFDVELLNRFTSVQNFHPITKTLFKEITAAEYEKFVSTVKKAHSSYSFLADTLSDTELDKLVNDNFVKEFGARPVQRMIQKYVEDTILYNKRTAANATITSAATA